MTNGWEHFLVTLDLTRLSTLTEHRTAVFSKWRNMPRGWEQARSTFRQTWSPPPENGFPLNNVRDEVKLTHTRNTSVTVHPSGTGRWFGQLGYTLPSGSGGPTRAEITANTEVLGRRIHGSVEDTKLSTNKQHSLSTSGGGQPSQRTLDDD